MPRAGHFSLDDKNAYQYWRDEKLSAYPTNMAELLVEVKNSVALTGAEKKAIIERCRKTNMLIYQFNKPVDDPADKNQLKKFTKQLGLHRLDCNLCADNDGITSLQVTPGGQKHTYIPYSTQRISWHTDGYYNTRDRQIRGMLLHCVSAAAKGGVNALLDPEIAYIHLREHNPDYIYALMRPQAMTIPANTAQGDIIRKAQSGPVFSVAGDGHLHMRYSARTRSIEWQNDETGLAARDCLTAFLNSNSEYIFRHRLEPAQGLLCNNVLHNRSAFDDNGEPRLLYRARYFDRIQAA
ncbi:MAG TPA: taurine catabolism dioxygenase TauD [Gammaproteobacteria bacterium]|nr:taurine catabolism dioxygenase TauD [Gammaproteobacteria bacterium]